MNFTTNGRVPLACQAVSYLNACSQSLGALGSLLGRVLPRVHQFWEPYANAAASLPTYLKAYVDAIELRTIGVGSEWESRRPVFFPGLRQHERELPLEIHIWTSARRKTTLLKTPWDQYVEQPYFKLQDKKLQHCNGYDAFLLVTSMSAH